LHWLLCAFENQTFFPYRPFSFIRARFQALVIQTEAISLHSRSYKQQDYTTLLDHIEHNWKIAESRYWKPE
jgi:hypothetical protein